MAFRFDTGPRDGPTMRGMGFPWNEVGSVGAAVAGIASAVAAGFALRISAGARRAAEDQAATSKDAAAAAVASAQAAVASAEVAATLARMEIDRRHDELAPRLQHRLEWRPGSTGENLFLVLTNTTERDYVFSGQHVFRSGGTSEVGYNAFGAGTELSVFVTSSRVGSPEKVYLEFDAATPCPCPRRGRLERHWGREFAVDAERGQVGGAGAVVA